MKLLQTLSCQLTAILALSAAAAGAAPQSKVSFQRSALVVPENLHKSIPIKILRTAGGSPVTVSFAVIGDTANSPEDFEATDGEIQFTAQETSRTLYIALNDDSIVEGNESFRVVLTGVDGQAELGANREITVTIKDDDRAGSVSVGTARLVKTEAEGLVELSVVRTGGKAGPVTVDVETLDGSAIGGQDYEPISGTLTFEAGELLKTLQVRVYNDFRSEGTQDFQVRLFNPTGSLAVGKRDRAVVQIKDNDVKPPAASGGKLTGSKTCTSYGFAVAGEDFSITQGSARQEYVGGQVVRKYGTILCVNTGRTYSFEAQFTWNSMCLDSVTLTVSGGILNPPVQTIRF